MQFSSDAISWICLTSNSPREYWHNNTACESFAIPVRDFEWDDANWQPTYKSIVLYIYIVPSAIDSIKSINTREFQSRQTLLFTPCVVWLFRQRLDSFCAWHLFKIVDFSRRKRCRNEINQRGKHLHHHKMNQNYGYSTVWPGKKRCSHQQMATMWHGTAADQLFTMHHTWDMQG